MSAKNSNHVCTELLTTCFHEKKNTQIPNFQEWDYFRSLPGNEIQINATEILNWKLKLPK
jgi:hypothetical protein